MSDKRIVFSTNTPNDQGFRIPNDVLDFSRYKNNPVLLSQHNWDDWKKDLLGRMTDLDFNDGEWSGIPEFHKKTEDSKLAEELWQDGYLKACSIGGFKTLKTTGRMTRDKDGNSIPEIWTDKDGLAEATHFEVYEISMVAIPSNMDAVQKEAFLNAQKTEIVDLGSKININSLEKELTTLSTKLKTMEDQELEAARLAAIEKDKKEKEAAKLAADKLASEKVIADKLKADKEAADKLKSAGDLPDPIAGAVAEEEKKKNGLSASIVEMFKSALAALSGPSEKPDVNILAAPAPKPDYEVKNSKEADKILFDKLKEEVGTMKAKQQLASQIETAKMEASILLTTALEAKEKSDKLEATAEDKEEFLKAKKAAEDAVELCSKMESDMEDMDDSDEMKAAKMAARKKEELAAKLSASKIRIKTKDELADDMVKLAAKPTLTPKATMIDRLPKSMTALKADPNGQKLIDRVTTRAEGVEPNEYAAYMSALRNEPKYKAVFDKTRIVLGANQGDINSYRSNPRGSNGIKVDEVISRLSANRWLNRNGQVQEASTLTATDNFLASPDLFAMDFLDLAIFKLFPTTSWKNDIPIFGADTTENNTGLIWANIAANPTVYMGSQPVNPTPYQYNDTAVSLNLTPFWLNPILWQPLTMAQLRYDQMGTGWAQSIAVLGTYIDDFLLYQLGLSVPHKSIVYSSGISPNPNGGNTAVQQFTLNGNADSPYSFYYNPLFAGSLNNPTLNDILMNELIYNKQNFELENEKVVDVLDPTTYTLIKQTAQSQSLLTRWVDDNGKDQLGFSHSKFNQRSRVIAFNPQTAQVLSPFGIIPSNVTSANLSFIPSQLGIGISNLDVFMIQSPVNYGYIMSADVRMGITPLRQNSDGLSMLAYGPQSVS